MLHNVASFFSFSTHAPAMGATESTNRIGVAGGTLQLTHTGATAGGCPSVLHLCGYNSRTPLRGATMYSNYSDDVSFSSRLFFSAHCSICFCLIAFVSADMEIRFPEATSADSG